MRVLLESMESAAQETLQQDASFYKAVQALKWEIDNDPQVRRAVGELKAAGRSVFSSFVPHIKVRVRTDEGVFALPKRTEIANPRAVEPVGRLVQELRSAARAVIKNSRSYHELGTIVNHAVGGSDRFEGIASEIENAGHEVLICLDLSAYVDVGGLPAAPRETRRVNSPLLREAPLPGQLSGSDRKFLKDLGISADES